MNLIILYTTSFGQGNYGFGEGMIITKQGDTIKCHVELAVTYGNKVAYKKSATGQQLSISAKEIKVLTTPHKYYENITLGKKERLMSLIVDGETKLYNHVTINAGPSKPEFGGTVSLYNAPTIIYALIKNGVIYELRKKDFKELIGLTLNDCQSITDKVNKNEYKFEDLEKIVNEYNACR